MLVTHLARCVMEGLSASGPPGPVCDGRAVGFLSTWPGVRWEGCRFLVHLAWCVMEEL